MVTSHKIKSIQSKSKFQIRKSLVLEEKSYKERIWIQM